MIYVIDRLLSTISFATCVKTTSPSSSAKLDGLSKYLPWTGLFIGLVLGSIAVGLDYLHCNAFLKAALIMVSWVVLTGGLHFDGLMDTADGLFSHRSRTRMLEIMEDSRVGNFGALTGFFVILLQVASLSSLSNSYCWQAVIVLPMVARWCAAYTIGKYPYAKENGMGKIWHDTINYPHDLVPALLFLVIAVGFCIHLHLTAILPATLGALMVGLLSARIINNVLGGHTGDTYGAIVQLSELGGLLAVALLSKQAMWL